MLVSQSELGYITLANIFLQGRYEVNILHFDDRATVKTLTPTRVLTKLTGKEGQSNLFYRLTPSINTTGIVVGFSSKKILHDCFILTDQL